MNIKILGLILLWWGLLVIGWVLRGWLCVLLMLLAVAVSVLGIIEAVYAEEQKEKGRKRKV